MPLRAKLLFLLAILSVMLWGSEMQTITKTEALNIVAECCENYESPYNTTAITNPAEKVLGLTINNYFQNRETVKVSDFAAYVMITLLPAVIDNSLYLGDGDLQHTSSKFISY